jgi:hypothetical protein
MDAFGKLCLTVRDMDKSELCELVVYLASRLHVTGVGYDEITRRAFEIQKEVDRHKES